MFNTPFIALSLTLLLTACTSAEPPAAPEPESAKSTATAVAPALPSKLLTIMESTDEALVPSPTETQSALQAAGIDAELAKLIENRDLDVTNQNLDNAAVRTGVIIADLLLSVKTADKASLIARLEKINTGLSQLQGGKDIDVTINDLQQRIEADAVSPLELIKELEELSNTLIPELTFEGQKEIIPLIQAGSWLEGANLVAKAIRATGNPSAADTMLKQPAVVSYFIRYVNTQGKEKAPAPITKILNASLQNLKALAEKDEPFTLQDLDTVINTTNNVLALL